MHVDGAGGVEPDAAAVGQGDLALFADAGAVIRRPGHEAAGQQLVAPGQGAEQTAARQRGQAGESLDHPAARAQALVRGAQRIGGPAGGRDLAQGFEAAADAFHVLPGPLVFLGGMQPPLPVRPHPGAGLAVAQARIPFGGLLQHGVGGFVRRGAGGRLRHEAIGRIKTRVPGAVRARSGGRAGSGRPSWPGPRTCAPCGPIHPVRRRPHRRSCRRSRPA